MQSSAESTWSWCPQGSLSTSGKSPTHTPFSQSFQATWSSPLAEGGGDYTRIPLSSGAEKHVDTYMIMNTTRNKTRTKHSKEVSKKWISQSLIIFEKVKSDFFTIQPVIEYIFQVVNKIYLFVYSSLNRKDLFLSSYFFGTPLSGCFCSLIVIM